MFKCLHDPYIYDYKPSLTNAGSKIFIIKSKKKTTKKKNELIFFADVVVLLTNS